MGCLVRAIGHLRGNYNSLGNDYKTGTKVRLS